MLWAREEICHQFYARDCNNHRPRIKGLHPSCCMIAFMPEELTFHPEVPARSKRTTASARRACSEHGALEPWRYLQSFSGASGLFKVYQILSGSRVFSKCSQTGPAGSEPRSSFGKRFGERSNKDSDGSTGLRLRGSRGAYRLISYTCYRWQFLQKAQLMCRQSPRIMVCFPFEHVECIIAVLVGCLQAFCFDDRFPVWDRQAGALQAGACLPASLLISRWADEGPSGLQG